jgi:hypothetical protein
MPIISSTHRPFLFLLLLSGAAPSLSNTTRAIRCNPASFARFIGDLRSRANLTVHGQTDWGIHPFTRLEIRLATGANGGHDRR